MAVVMVSAVVAVAVLPVPTPPLLMAATSLPWQSIPLSA
jgi:hypothetical protein